MSLAPAFTFRMARSRAITAQRGEGEDEKLKLLLMDFFAKIYINFVFGYF